jgi:hypothetical protein
MCSCFQVSSLRLLAVVDERVLVCSQHNETHPLSTGASSAAALGRRLFLLPAPALEDGDKAVTHPLAIRLAPGAAREHGPSCPYCHPLVQPLFAAFLDVGQVRKVGCPVFPPPPASAADPPLRLSRRVSSTANLASDAAPAPVV